MKILVTGATGHLGTSILNHILENNTQGHTILASARNVDKARDFAARGVEVRHADFDDPASLEHAFSGIDRVVIVSTDGDTQTRIAQHAAAIDAAKRSGVKRILYTSLTKADDSPLNLADVHKDTEARIQATGIPYSILRNNWYLENEIDTIKTALSTGLITTTYGNGQLGWMLRDEYGEAAAMAALEEVEGNKIYTISNALHTIEDFAGVLSTISGKEITVKQIDDAALEDGLLKAGLDQGTADFVSALNRGIREGGLAATSNDFEHLVKHQPKSLEQETKELIAIF